ncbi:acetyl-CoA carboxylase biotin carboxyl carrier protein subunit [Beijerinckia sp. L45]|uniref:acetyl-CoA carboxylase biotin carboxyl carrier protein n=1 Tax=Beijerinckia sp. L45 TaxID=1641855 RepID=UPI00131DDA28|nr:acetyl-CoA carboxylase biotin carboxyl carrier protein subunit [Beijerinckia sp. L45]
MSKPPHKAEEPALDRTELVESLADIAKRLDLSEIEYQTGDLKIRVARQMTTTIVHGPASAPAPAAQAAPAADVAKVEHPGTVKSPMVGTAYVRPAPESAPFVDIGSVVKAGDKILLVEAMKTFNEIIAPRGGTVTSIMVADGQPVEYGQALLVIE